MLYGVAKKKKEERKFRTFSLISPPPGKGEQLEVKLTMNHTSEMKPP